MEQRSLQIGDPAPWFSAAEAPGSRPIAFDELAGRFILLFFFGSGSRPDIAAALAALDLRDDVFDGERALFLGVSSDPDEFARDRPPIRKGLMRLLDASGGAAARYGLTGAPSTSPGENIRPTAFLLSPSLQILSLIPFDKPNEFIGRSVALLNEALASPARDGNAPVLIVPRVFSEQFCRRLIELYDSHGGQEIGAIENKGQVVERFDPTFRKRLDYYVSDGEALQTCKEALEQRLLPLVYRAFQFPTTRIERYLVGCYDAGSGGYFRPHRDNTAPPVAHRRFALSLILNDGYQGGELRFPEFGGQTVTAAPGDAIVFSCSLLHEVTPVTSGRRYAFLTFLYDEPSQKIRDAYAQKQA